MQLFGMEAKAGDLRDCGDHSASSTCLFLFRVRSFPLVVPHCSHCMCEDLAVKKIRILAGGHSGQCDEHPKSFFLLTFFLGHLWMSLLSFLHLSQSVSQSVPFSLGHSRALKKEIKTFIYCSLLKLPHRIMWHLYCH